MSQDRIEAMMLVCVKQQFKFKHLSNVLKIVLNFIFFFTKCLPTLWDLFYIYFHIVASCLLNFRFNNLICFLYLVGVLVWTFRNIEKPISEHLFFEGVSIGKLVAFVIYSWQNPDLFIASLSLVDIVKVVFCN